MRVETGLVPIASQDKRRPRALQGVQIQSRDPTIRAQVLRLYRQCSWLSAPDAPAAVRYVVLQRRFSAMYEHLREQPVVTGKDTPRKMDGELRACSRELSNLEAALGLTAASRAALGVDLARMQDLASQMSASEGMG